MFDFRMQHDDLPLAIYDNQNDKKLIKKKVEDWNEIEVMSISEVLVAFEVSITVFLSL